MNAILPGIINTAMAAMLVPEELIARVAGHSAQAAGVTRPIGSAAEFLASDMPGYVTDAMLEFRAAGSCSRSRTSD